MELKMTKKKILIVDDELMLLLSMQRMLEDSYDISTATGGRQAINMINQENDNFDLIITDINMPDVNGVDLYFDVQKNHPNLAKRMIFMTGANLTTDIKNFLNTNKNICISKPFESDLLFKVIEDFINN
jgi:DNA-binding NtrC family response regulator